MGESMTFVSFYCGKIGFEAMGLRKLSPLGMGSNKRMEWESKC